MSSQKEILAQITKSVKSVFPEAEVILFGSRARGDSKADSDFDLLVLIDKEKVNREDEKKVKYPLYEIEFETGKIISPLVLSKRDWETRHPISPFFETVSQEGIRL